MCVPSDGLHCVFAGIFRFSVIKYIYIWSDISTCAMSTSDLNRVSPDIIKLTVFEDIRSDHRPTLIHCSLNMNGNGTTKKANSISYREISDKQIQNLQFEKYVSNDY